jgi:hypothetical protein
MTQGRRVAYWIVAIGWAVFWMSGCAMRTDGTASVTEGTIPRASSPPIITDVSAGAIVEHGATLSWTTDVPSTSQVEYGTEAGYGSWSKFDDTRVTSHVQALTGLAPSTLYHYRVQSEKDPDNPASMDLAVSADNTFTTAAPSTEVPVGRWGAVTTDVSSGAAVDATGRILTVRGEFSPTAPTDLAASGGSGSIALTWTAATGARGVASYNIHRSTTSGFALAPDNRAATGVLDTSFVDTGLGAGTYFYLVTAEDPVGNVGQPSNEASATLVTGDTTPPTAPTNLQATAISTAQVTLAWNAATDDVGVVRYNVLRNGNPIASSIGTAYNDTTASTSTTYVYTVTAQDAANNVGPPSNAATVTTPSPSAGITLDAEVVTHQASGGTTISSPPFTTTGAGEVILVFLASDGANPGFSFSAVSGGGLSWRLRQRSNGQLGTSEVWQAVAPSPLSSVVVTATRAMGAFQGLMVVQSFKGADTTIDGAVASSSSPSGAPTVSLTTTRAGSQVWGVGNDFDRAVARTVGGAQTKVDEFLSPSGDTLWVQRRTNPSAAAGVVVTISDTAPTGDRYNLAAIEILPAP